MGSGGVKGHLWGLADLQMHKRCHWLRADVKVKICEDCQ